MRRDPHRSATHECGDVAGRQSGLPKKVRIAKDIRVRRSSTMAEDRGETGRTAPHLQSHQALGIRFAVSQGAASGSAGRGHTTMRPLSPRTRLSASRDPQHSSDGLPAVPHRRSHRGSQHRLGRRPGRRDLRSLPREPRSPARHHEGPRRGARRSERHGWLSDVRRRSTTRRCASPDRPAPRRHQPVPRTSWSNLRSSDPLLIRVELAEEGVGTATIAVEWPSGASSFTEHTTWVQRPGQCRKPGNDVLGWASALRECSPLLPQEELDRLLTASPTSYTTSWSRSSGWADSRTLRTGQ